MTVPITSFGISNKRRKRSVYLRVNGEVHSYFVFFDLKKLFKNIRKYEIENLCFIFLSFHSKTKKYYITYKQ